MQAELKRHLLVRPHSVEQRDGRAERLKIQVADRKLDLLQERLDGGHVNVRLARPGGAPLNLLLVRQFEIVWDSTDGGDSLGEQLEGFLAAAIKVRDVCFRQEAPAQIVKRARVGIVAVRADLDVGVLWQSDGFEHFVKLLFNATAQ